MNKRQCFFSERHHDNFLKEYHEVIELSNTTPLQASSPEEEATLRSTYLLKLSLDKLLATYTVGAEVSSMVPALEELVERYEIRQLKLAEYLGIPNISPLAISDWVDQYEECVQVIGFCILLHCTDLLTRFAKLLDNAGYAATDTLYEDLLAKVLPDRNDVDQWYHDVYSPLIRAIYADDKKEASSLLQNYCQEWYQAFEQAPWHDTHLQGEDGNYVGYWAIEAGAIAFLYGIDDSKIDHMVYPKDLVEYARNYTGEAGSQTKRTAAGEPCSKTGYWFTPAQVSSRRHFQQGEVMPGISDSKWGDTLWYWSGEN
ncbi:DUF1911 domain-containing protein [Pseudomonas sp. CDFA 553]|uniref:PoNe immunity protein domain-containing protein n=1 Tax=Pseudomonas quasicaspiana TaxID=2829821 RepID=UPI001E46063F|nr:PoNe immunity protein domain-containing protein [Pseudomonas quasicaspiana]MCD5991968.1 DUF1911 domain-containing protein [Pseudomonas quasicaspiana]